jgi:OOP family OmpA-OmpF porin
VEPDQLAHVAEGVGERRAPEQRADAVRAYLVEKGVPEGQLTAVGYGAERPAVATGNEVAMAANRRIEFTVSQ